MSVPITTLTLYRTMLAQDTTVMDSATHTSYLASLTPFQVINCTFQRQNREMRLPISMDIAERYNYGSFVNNGRTFYCFIYDMEYINDNMTKASYSIDYWHTYQDDIQYSPTVIARKIVKKSDDILGKYTAEEPIAPSTFISHDSWTDITGPAGLSGNEYWYWLVDNGNGFANIPSHNYGPQDFIGNARLTDDIGAVEGRVAAITFLGNYQAIQGLWVVPKSMVNDSSDIANDPMTIYFKAVTIPSSVDSYTIKNNKLKTSPFFVLGVMSSDGNSLKLNIQDVIASDGETDIYFTKHISLVPAPSAKVYPSSAYHDTNSVGYMTLAMDNFPTLNVAVPAVTIKDAIKILSSGVSAVSGLDYQLASRHLTNANMEAVANTRKGKILNKLDYKKAKALYDLNDATTLGNVGGSMGNLAEAIASISGSVGVKGKGSGADWAAGQIGFTITLYTPDREQTEQIDSFFSRYGYTIEQIEMPELHNRTFWDYCQTKDASFSIPNAPVVAEQAINQMFDSGLTIWHSSHYFKDYSIDNL